jgi:hypothetical protein
VDGRIGVLRQFKDNDTCSSRHPTALPACARSICEPFAMRVHMNSADTIEGLDSGYFRLSSPQILRPLHELYHWIDERLPDNCTQEIILPYEVGHRGTESIISHYKSRTQSILQ